MFSNKRLGRLQEGGGVSTQGSAYFGLQVLAYTEDFAWYLQKKYIVNAFLILACFYDKKLLLKIWRTHNGAG